MGGASPRPLAALPAVHVLLKHDDLVELPRELVLPAARQVLDEVREQVRTDGAAVPPLPELVRRIRERVGARREPAVRRVLNATGVVLHTNLGRAPLGAEVAEAVQEAASGYCTVEVDLSSGGRGERLERVREQLVSVTGAEDAVVVNNNAAAVLLALTALARGQRVVVSRGELVEIGGSFRVPEVVAAGGADLEEVGTTNRTRVEDYARALDVHRGGDPPPPAGILRVHPSNFRVLGFTERPDRGALARLARDRGRWMVEDLGSGNLVEGIEGEPTVRDVVAAGVHLVTFSGDKLLGGPQCGVVVGSREWVSRLRGHPLYRALRVDKLILAALDTTLRLHREGRSHRVPALAMLRMSPEALRSRATAMAVALRARDPVVGVEVSAEPVEGRAGAGALPEQSLGSHAVAIRGLDVTALARALRQGSPPLLGRVHRDTLYLDPRTLLPGEDEQAVAAVTEALSSVRPVPPPQENA